MERILNSRVETTAIFDEHDEFSYRYSLKKVWHVGMKKATLIMLNPSIANHLIIDNSIMRAMNYFITQDKLPKFGELEVVNLFAYINTDSSTLRTSSKYIGSKNDHYIKLAIENTDLIVVSWGSDNEYKGRKKEVLEIIGNRSVYYFKDATDRTIPVHISRLSNNFYLEPYPPKLTGYTLKK